MEILNSILAWLGLLLILIVSIVQIYLDVLVRKVYKKLAVDEKRMFHFARMKHIHENENRVSDKKSLQKIRWLKKFELYIIGILFFDYGVWVLLNW